MYLYWIGAINIGWEATIGTPEEVSYCMRQAGFKAINYWDIHHLPNAMSKPRHHFTPYDAPLQQKYGTSEGQLSVESFNDKDRHFNVLRSKALLETHPQPSPFSSKINLLI